MIKINIICLSICLFFSQMVLGIEGTEIAANTVYGKVLCEDMPVSGVVISDGYNLTKTNVNGDYSLSTDLKLSDFVFISIPSGYEVVSDNPICKFYAPLSKTESSQEKNFVLRRVDNKNHVVIVASDMHISGVVRPKASAIDTVMFRNGYLKDIAELQKSYPAETKFYGLNLGDMVWEQYWKINKVWYPEYIKMVQGINFPMFHTIGNHDYDDNYENDDRASEQEYKKYLGPTYYSLNIGNVHYVMLDNMIYNNDNKSRKYDVTLSQNQLDWLKKDLEMMPADTKNVIVGLHCPTIRRNPISKQGMTNRNELYSLLNKYNAILLSGHNHFCETIQIADNMREYIFPSVCGASWYVQICCDGSPAGYGIFEVNGDDIKHYKKFIGHPSDFQFKVYNKEVYDNEGSPAILVNLFDWNDDWTVESTVNGKAAKVKRITGKDPYYLHEMYEKGYLGKHNAYIPYNTDHLFCITPSNSDSEVTIIVKNKITGYEKTVKTKIGF